MNEFQRQAISAAGAYGGDKTLSDPVVVAGLADIVKNATAAMARAKQAGQNLTSGVNDLLNHVAAVESIHQQVTAANTELSAAIATVGAPLDDTQHSGINSEAVSAGPAPSVAPTVPVTDGAAQFAPSAPPPFPPTTQMVQGSVKQVELTNANLNAGPPVT